MIFHFNGRFNGEPETLPGREHEPGYVPFKEPGPKKLALVLNIIAVVITIPLVIIVKSVSGGTSLKELLAALAMFFASIPIHEFIHALMFKEDVYMYTWLNKGICFVIGPELMSKSRFVLMSIMPNIVFGFLPFILFCIFPNFGWLGWLGAASIGCGAGDYMNIFNCLTQVPTGAKIYMHGLSSFWVR